MRISTGVTVNVSANTERWLSELRAGRGFGGQITQAAVAGQFSYTQIFNPVASGITVLVRNISVGSGANDGFFVAHYNTALATLGSNTRNLLSGGAAPVAEMRSATDAAVLGSRFHSGDTLVSTTTQLSAEWFTELGAGEGLIIQRASANITSAMSVLWIEV